eukprot:12880200-Prorocentrum_lima.AAC.1
MPDYYWNRWDGLDGFGNSMTNWSTFVDKVETDMPAGLLELEALAHALYLRIAVCCPTSSRIIWVGQPLRQQA